MVRLCGVTVSRQCELEEDSPYVVEVAPLDSGWMPGSLQQIQDTQFFLMMVVGHLVSGAELSFILKCVESNALPCKVRAFVPDDSLRRFGFLMSESERDWPPWR